MKETGVGSLIRATSFWRRAEFQRGCMVYSVAMILTWVGSTMFLLWAPRMTSNELPPSVQWAAVKIQSEAMMVAPQNHELSTTRATCLPFEFLSLIFKPMKFDYISRTDHGNSWGTASTPPTIRSDCGYFTCPQMPVYKKDWWKLFEEKLRKLWGMLPRVLKVCACFPLGMK